MPPLAQGQDARQRQQQWQTFSQFQVYCASNLPTANEALEHMKWPVLMRFFDSYEIPGYALVFSQGAPGKYYGESYWIGWEIPWWMSLPPFLLSDDDKRKLCIYWIALQRRVDNLYKYSKLSVMICTYYPTQQQLAQRRANLGPNLYAFQPSQNRGLPGVDNPNDIAAIVNSPRRDEMVYQIQGGKGADLARNKNIPLSYLVDNPQRLMGSDPRSNDDWLNDPFPSLPNDPRRLEAPACHLLYMARHVCGQPE